MVTSVSSKLKDPEFWSKMEQASRKAQEWPEWMKGSPVNKREPKAPALAKDTAASK